MQQPQRSDDMPFWQKIQVMQALCAYPALTFMLFTRRNLGFRILNPLSLFKIAAVMFLVSCFAANTPGYDGLWILAVIVVIGGLAERRKRQREMKRGVLCHSFYIGDSIFEFKWLPNFLRRNRRIPRFVDPLVAFAVGFLLLPVSPSLGGWVIFSGFCLRVFEDAVWRREMERSLDTMDAIIESETQVHIVEHFPDAGSGKSHAETKAPGIPTGMGPDVKKTIRERDSSAKQHQEDFTNNSHN